MHKKVYSYENLALKICDTSAALVLYLPRIPYQRIPGHILRASRIAEMKTFRLKIRHCILELLSS